MNTSSDWLLKACTMLGLKVEIGFSLTLPDGHTLRSIARVPAVGAENGMLVFSSYNEVSDYADELIRAGYGFSVLDDPRPDEEFDLDSFKDMFADWNGREL